MGRIKRTVGSAEHDDYAMLSYHRGQIMVEAAGMEVPGSHGSIKIVPAPEVSGSIVGRQEERSRTGARKG